MDGSIEVPVAELQAAGAAGVAVSDGLRGVDVAAPPTRLGAGLPGGASALAARDAAAGWADTAAALADGVAEHARAVTDSATAYTHTETTIAQLLRGLG